MEKGRPLEPLPEAHTKLLPSHRRAGSIGTNLGACPTNTRVARALAARYSESSPLLHRAQAG